MVLVRFVGDSVEPSIPIFDPQLAPLHIYDEEDAFTRYVNAELSVELSNAEPKKRIPLAVFRDFKSVEFAASIYISDSTPSVISTDSV